ncbi:MAG: hypothetical protein QOK89_03345 [Nitrososphaeraceae archaeon]|jgi:hypothetical protein|nr:hypothetical protein [Nitrososphaeraceae archaeon]
MVYENPVIIISFILIFLFSIGFSIQSVYGHTEIKVGNYTIEAGWSNEPPLINNLNEVVIFIFENDSPVRNAMKDLSVSINYGGISKKLNFLPSEESVGQYLADIIPSNLGTYSLNLKGTIGTQNINNDIQIEEVEDAKKLTFPIVSESSNSLENIGKQITPIMKDLSNQIEETKEQVNSTKQLIQKMDNEDNSIKSEIERTNLLSYIATALSASAIILIASRGKVKKLRE